MNVLVTGGAGFIGSWTVDLLLDRGYNVTILDSLEPRVHPYGKPSWLQKDAKFIEGNVLNYADLSKALDGQNAVIHLAAYQDYLTDFSNFIHTNAGSSALIFEMIEADRKKYPVEKIIFASSQAVCGEGEYRCKDCGEEFSPEPRSQFQLERGLWEIFCPFCGSDAENILINETVCNPTTTYGISKYAIELLAKRLGDRLKIPTFCMRYTYVQGARNSFYNAYSGIARRFALQIMNHIPPTIYEDGRQLRDYVNVKDVARANVLALEDKILKESGVYNVGGGKAITVNDFAKLMLKEFNSDLEPNITGEYRIGDTRHTVSGISKIRWLLDWTPEIPVEQNVKEYVEWIKEQKVDKRDLISADNIMRGMGVIKKANG